MWYIGQKIVAIQNALNGRFKEGDEFIIKTLRSTSCNCNDVEIDIGFNSAPHNTHCGICHKLTYSSGIVWFSENNFAPLDEIQAHEVAVNELLQELNLQPK